jgi:LuxS protein involved in autoinducer AI2 synthesis
MELRKIASFQVDHRKLPLGMYISRTDGDIVTYDLRMVRPNTPPYLENGSLHTIEHLFATYARSSALSDKVVYVGPMGCRTGFYFLTRAMSHSDAIRLVQESFAFIASFEGAIPGAAEAECGNWKEHDLAGARADAAKYAAVLEAWTEAKLKYPE